MSSHFRRPSTAVGVYCLVTISIFSFIFAYNLTKLLPQFTQHVAELGCIEGNNECLDLDDPFIAPNLTPSRTTSQHITKRGIVVIHAGPHKMSSTTLQMAIRKDQKHLLSDNYTTYVKAYELAWCMGAQPLRCDKIRSLNIKKKMKYDISLGMNLLISLETFSHPDLNMTQLRNFFQPMGVDVRVILMYRRFHEWLPSVYNQRFKSVMYGKEFNDDDDNKIGKNLYPSLVEWLSSGNVKEMYDKRYTIAVVERYRRYFDDVTVFNLHDTDDMAKDIYCKMVPYAIHTCNNATHDKRTLKLKNKSIDLNYNRLARAANDEGLLREGVKIGSVAKRIKSAMKKVLNFTTMDDLPQECLSPDMMQMIQNISIASERRLFPDFFESSGGEMALRASFDNSVTKYCNVNVKEVLKDDHWRRFFQRL